MNMKTESTAIRRLRVATLMDALRAMEVGETSVAPEGYKEGAVRAACYTLKAQGYIFSTSMRSGVQTITRIK